MNDLHAELGYATALELKARFERRELSPVEAVSGILDRIAALEPAINAFSVVTRDDALAAARDSERRLRSGEARPLEGIPVTIKDAFGVAGYETATCTHALRGPVAREDNIVVARLRDAGALEQVEPGRAAGSNARSRSELQRPSMAQDMAKGRRTEIDFINGLIVAEGQKLGVTVDNNQRLTETVKRVERGDVPARPENLA